MSKFTKPYLGKLHSTGVFIKSGTVLFSFFFVFYVLLEKLTHQKDLPDELVTTHAPAGPSEAVLLPMATSKICEVDPTKDNYIHQKDPGRNYGSSQQLYIEQKSGETSRGLIHFDLSAFSGQSLVSARLRIYLNGGEGKGNIVNAYNLTRDWTEGAQNGTNGQANWNQAASGTNWTSAGGDYNSTSLGSTTTTNQGWKNINLTPAAVQAWIDNPASNYGVILTNTGGQENKLEFESSEGSGSRRPYLELTFPFNSSLVPTDVSCNGGSDGSINTIVLTPGSYTYNWSNGATTDDISGLTAGTYTLTITDPEGCEVIESVAVGEPTALTAVGVVTALACNGTNGAIDLTPGGGTPPYLYNWSHGPVTQDVSGLNTGTYTVTVTDANLCTVEETVEVAIVDVTETHVDVSCNGGSDGSINITSTGGVLPHTYAWSHGPTTEDASGLPAGSYTVTVTDAVGCTDQIMVTITEPTTLTSSATITSDYNTWNVSCNGGSDGFGYVTAGGGTPPYSYNWTNGQTTDTLMNAAEGNHFVTVTDALGCTSVSTFYLSQPPAMGNTINITSWYNGANISCNGATDGSATASGSGGVPGYTYAWSNSQTGPNLTNVGAGTYTVTVTDNNGCTFTDNITINEPNTISINFTPTTPSCPSDTDGQLVANAGGGTAGYTYAWAHGPTGNTVTGLAAGSYTVTATDANGCTGEGTYILNDPAVLTASATGNDASCAGVSDGSIDLTVGGGTPAYSYDWDYDGTGDNDDPQDPAGLAAGTHNVTVTDSRGCTATTSVVVGEPAAIVIDTAVTNINCNNTVGAIDITVSGGASDYSYNWGDIAGPEALWTFEGTTDDQTINNHDLTGVSAGGTVLYSNDAVYSSQSHSFNGATSLRYSVNSGFMEDDFTYVTVAMWVKPSSLTGIQTIFERGGNTRGYAIRLNGNTLEGAVRDASVTQTAGSLTFPADGQWHHVAMVYDNGALTLYLDGVAGSTTATGYTTILAHGNNSGIGGTRGSDAFGNNLENFFTGLVDQFYYYTTALTTAEINANMSNYEDRSNLTAGMYYLTVTDGAGCTMTDDITINNNADPALSYSKADESCNVGSDGSIDLTVSNGEAPFIYDWDNDGLGDNDDPEDLTGLMAGTYKVTVTDNAGCMDSLTVVITGGSGMDTSGSSTTDESCAVGGDGSINLEVTGGTAPYTYNWSTGATTQDISGLTSGFYYVTINDAIPCVRVDTFLVGNTSSLNVTSNVVDVLCTGNDMGSIDLTVSGGTPAYTFEWDVRNPEAFWPMDGSTDDESGNSHNLISNTGTINYSIDAAYGAQSFDFDGMTKLRYSENAGGFMNDDFSYLTVAMWIKPSGLTGIQTLFERGNVLSGFGIRLNGSTLEGAVRSGFTQSNAGNLTFPSDGQWHHLAMVYDNGDLTLYLDGVAGATTATGFTTIAGSNNSGGIGGTYGFSDAFGAWANNYYTGLIDEIAYYNEALSTNQVSDAMNDNEDRSDLFAGIYSVTVTDAGGCTYINSFTITESSGMTLSAVGVDVNCAGEATGSIDLTVTNYINPLSFLWSTGETTEDIVNLTGGYYTVTVTNGDGCTAVLTDTIAPPDTIAILNTVKLPTCNGDSNGEIDLTITGNTPPYTYAWSHGPSTQDVTGLTAGTYTVTVTDVNSCVGTASITVPDPPVFSPAIADTDVSCNGADDGTITVTPNGGIPNYDYFWGDEAVAGFWIFEQSTDDASGNGTDAVSITGTEAYSSIAQGGNYSFIFDGATKIRYSQDFAFMEIPFAQRSVMMWVRPDNFSSNQILFEEGDTNDGMAISLNGSTLVGGVASGGILQQSGTFTFPNDGDWHHVALVFDGGDLTLYLDGIASATNSTGFPGIVPSMGDDGGIGGGFGTHVFGATENFFEGLIDNASYHMTALSAEMVSDAYTTNNQSRTNLAPGNYQVTAMDGNGCQVILNATISEPAAFTASATGEALACFGDSDGDITLTVSGGTTPYTFDWDNDGTGDNDDTQNLSGLTAGTYNVTVTDANGCTATASADITEPAAFTASATGEALVCSGDSDGNISLTVSGGTLPYTFDWDNDGTGDNDDSQNLAGLTAGTYNVTVTDASGCTATASADITEPATFTASATGEALVCSGDTDGDITLTVSGGTPGGSCSTTQIGNDATTNGTNTDSWDSNMCILEDRIYTNSSGVTEYIDIQIFNFYAVALADPVTPFIAKVNGDNDFTVVAIGTTRTNSDYVVGANTFAFSDTPGQIALANGESIIPGFLDANADGTGGGTGSVIPYDNTAEEIWYTGGSLGTHSGSVTLGQAPTPGNSGPMTGLTRTYHFNIDICPSTTPNYTFAWSNGATDQNISGLTAGTYTVTITDASGCTLTASADITEPAAFTASATGESLACFGDSDGDITLTVSGGTSPYTFDWDNDGTGDNDDTQNLSGLGAGTYNVTVTDASGCTTTANADITEPAAFTANASGEALACNGDTDGNITLTISGGVTPYTFDWDNDGTGDNDDTQNLSGLTAGTYNVTVTDASGCTATASADITEPAAMTATAIGEALDCNGDSDGDITLSVSGGNPAGSCTNQQIGNSATTNGTSMSGWDSNLYILEDRTYTNTSGGTEYIDLTNFNFYAAASADPVTPFLVKVNGDNNFTVIAIGTTRTNSDYSVGANTFDFADSPSQLVLLNGETIAPGFLDAYADGSGSGLGPVIPYDDTGEETWYTGSSTGTGSGAVALGQSPTPTIGSGGVYTNLSRTFRLNIDFCVSTTPPYNYAWSNGSTDQNLSGLTAGTYTVTVTDGAGCSTTASATITEPSAIDISSTTTLVSCPTYNDGAIDITVTGGSGPYSYSWDDMVPSSYTGHWPFENSTDDVSGNNYDMVSYSGSIAYSTDGVVGNSFDFDDATRIQYNDGTFMESAFSERSVMMWIKPTNLTGTEILFEEGSTVTGFAVRLNGNTLEGVVTESYTRRYPGSHTFPNDGAWHHVALVYDNGNITLYLDGVAGTTTNSGLGSIPAHNYDGGIGGTYVTDAFGSNNNNYFGGLMDEWSLHNTALSATDIQNAFNNPTTEDRTGLTTGDYTVTVTDADGCSAVSTINVGTIPSMNLTAVADTLLCFGDTDGNITLSVTGGSPPYSFDWDYDGTGDNDDPQNPGGLSAGTYAVTVTDANGCTTSTSADITEPAELTLSNTKSDVNCNGGNDGSITLTVSGGTAPFTYDWDNDGTGDNDDTKDLSGLTAGDYNVTVTDANGCTATLSETITEPTVLSATLVATDVTCNAANNGSVDLTPSGGTPGYTYNWSNGATTEDLSNVAGGDYDVTVTDANSCTFTSTITVNEPGPLSATASVSTDYNGEDVSCPGDSDGGAMVSAAGGTGPYTFLWDDGGASTNDSLFNIAAGTYNVTVTDANGCTATSSVTLNDPTPLNIADVVTDVACNGDSTGAIDVTITGGVTDLSYQWSDWDVEAFWTFEETTDDVSGNGHHQNGGAGSIGYPGGINNIGGSYAARFNGNKKLRYSVNGGGFMEQAFDYRTIAMWVDPDVLTGIQTLFEEGNSTHGWILALNNNTLIAAVRVWGAEQSITGIPFPNDGNYHHVALVYDYGQMSLYLDGVLMSSIATGFTTVPSNGGNGGVGGTFGSDAFGLSTNNYYDGKLDEVSYHTSALNADQIADMAGYTGDRTNLAAGTYTLMIADGNGCPDTATITVNEPAILSLSTTSTDASCNGDSDGAINLTINGGTPVYSQLWSNGATTTNVSGLTAGIYFVTVTDANGCTAVATDTINENPAITASAVATDVSCFGGSDGSIDLTVSGGSGSYTYLWNNGAGTAEDPSGLSANAYSVTITDTNGCTFILNNVVVGEPGGIALSTVVSNVSCFGGSDGSIDLSIVGGTSPFTFNWDNGAGTGEDPSGLSIGNYSVTVTDANSCTAVTSATVSEPTDLTISATILNVACNGGGDGAVINVNISGGTPGFTYWYDDFGLEAYYPFENSTDDFSGNTNHSTAFTGTESYSADAQERNNSFDFDGSSKIKYSVNGGFMNGTVDYRTISMWVKPSTFVPGFQTLYEEGDVSNGLMILLKNDSLVYVANEGFSIAYNITQFPQDGAWHHVALVYDNGVMTTYLDGATVNSGNTGFGSISIPFFAEGGLGGTFGSDVWGNFGNNFYNGLMDDVRYHTNALDSLQIDAIIKNDGDRSGLQEGTYTITVMDANDCAKTEPLNVAEPPALTISSDKTNVDCNGNSTGAIDVKIGGGTPGYTYNWSTGATTEDISGLTTGTYDLTVTDANGCTITLSETITEPSVLSAAANVTSNYNGNDISCGGAADGTASAAGSGGTVPYTYNWSTGSTFPNISGLAAGTYWVTVTDGNGCTTITSVTLSDPPVINVATNVTSDYNGADVTCNGASDASFGSTVSGGAGGFTYLWSTGSTADNISGVTAGTYMLTVTDAFGCTQADTITVTEPAVLDISLALGADYNGNGVSCSSASDGSINSTTTGGTSPYTYSWSGGQTTANLTNLGPGTYTVTVTDVNGCTATDNITISAPPNISFTVSSSDLTDCGANDGIILVSASGGTGGYEYRVNTGAWQSSNAFTGLSSGTYDVYVRNEYGTCQAGPVTVVIDVPETPVINNIVIVNPSTGLSTDGSIFVNASGNGVQLNYRLNGVTGWQSNTVFNNLSVGTYTVEVKYYNQTCISSQMVELTAGGGVVGSNSNETDYCSGELNAAQLVETYYIPFPEDNVATSLLALHYPGCGYTPHVSEPMQTYVSIGVVENETIIYYDHWEDGYEANLSFPVQTTTEVWGDGNIANGIPPGFAVDIINAADIIILNNAVQSTTRQTVIDFDAGDKIGSRGNLAMTRLAWASGTNTLLGGALEVYPTSVWGTNFEVPVGTNTDVNFMFEYTGLVAMATENNTTVNIDTDANGTDDVTVILNEGETYFVDGTLFSGATVNASANIQVHLITGDICAAAEARFFTLKPVSQWSDSYLNPVSTLNDGDTHASSTNNPTYIHLYNPSATSTITVTGETNAGVVGTVNVGPKGTAWVEVPDGTGSRVYTTNGAPFYAIATIDSDGDGGGNRNSAHDWGFALMPESQTSPQITLVGFAPGQDPTLTCDATSAISKSSWSVLSADSEETGYAATNAIDEDNNTYWMTEYLGDPDPAHPHEIQIDLGGVHDINGFRYLPRQGGTGSSQTVASTDVPIAFNAGETITSTLTFPQNWTISDINVIDLDITHADIEDLRIRLTSPDGTHVPLYDQDCGNSDEDFFVDFDDEAGSTMPCPTTNGNAYRPPAGTLSDFDGETANGVWTLTIVSNSSSDDGTLNGWGIEVTNTSGGDGSIEDYEFYISSDAVNWGAVQAAGTFEANSAQKEVTFNAVQGRYVRLVANSEVNGNPWTSIAELDVLECTSTFNENSAPVWITADYPTGSTSTGSITICIDYDGDGGANTDVNGVEFDESRILSELDHTKIYDADGDQTGMRIWVCDGSDAIIAGAWGQDPATASGGAPAIDLGAGLPNGIPFSTSKCLDISKDYNLNGLFDECDEVIYTIIVQNSGVLPLSTGYLTMIDTMPAGLTYIENSTFYVDGSGQNVVTDDTSPASPFPLDEGGFGYNSVLLPGDSIILSFEASIDPLAAGTIIDNMAHIATPQTEFTPEVSFPVENPTDPSLSGIPADITVTCDSIPDPPYIDDANCNFTSLDYPAEQTSGTTAMHSQNISSSGVTTTFTLTDGTITDDFRVADNLFPRSAAQNIPCGANTKAIEFSQTQEQSNPEYGSGSTSTFEMNFSQVVENLSFTINDLDEGYFFVDGVVVRIYDGSGTEIDYGCGYFEYGDNVDWLGDKEFQALDNTDGFTPVEDTLAAGDVKFNFFNFSISRVVIEFRNNWTTSSTTLNTSATDFTNYMATNAGITHEIGLGQICYCIPGTNNGTVLADLDCGNNVNIVFNETTTSGSCSFSYTLTRTWTASDNCGNITVETQTIEVQDTTAPVMTGFPSDITVTPSTIPDTAVVIISDDCDNSPVLVFEETNLTNPCTYIIYRIWDASDECGNVQRDTQFITVDALITSTTSVTTDYNTADISCNGASDGGVKVSPAGGVEPYVFNWSNGSTDSTATNLAAGMHYVTVTDDNGCAAIDSIQLTEPAAMVISASITSDYNGEDISCNGGADGTGFAFATGGIGSKTYNWSNGQTGQPLLNVGAGTYSLTVTDANGCTAVDSITFTDPAELTAAATVGTDYNGEDVSCPGASDGQAQVIPNGGVSPYSVSWSTGQTDAIINSLGAGTYTVTVTDANSCTTTGSVTINDPTPVSVSLSIYTDYNGEDISCAGTNDGGVAAAPAGGASGGSGVYTYLWSTGSTNDSLLNVGSGTYTVTVTDVNGCSSSASITLNDPAPLSASIAVTSDFNGADLSCFGAADGEATVTPSGGVSTYSYAWDDPGSQTTQTATGLSAGTYNVTVTDQNSCFIVASITVNDPTQLTVDLGPQINACSSIDTILVASVTGGTGTVTYLWDTGETNDSITVNHSSPTTHYVTVTDENSCTAVDSVLVNILPCLEVCDNGLDDDGDGLVDCDDPDCTFSVNISSVADTTTCNGSMDGSVTATPSGGKAPYTYLWDDPSSQTTSTASGLGAGTYTVTITDDFGCSGIASVTVYEPAVITLTTASNPTVSCNGGNDGYVNLTVSGGTPMPTAPAYTFSWNTGATTEDINSLIAGTYTVTVTDANGCTASTSVVIGDPAILGITLNIDSVYNGVHVSCLGASDGNASAAGTGGVGPYSYEWSNGQTGDKLVNVVAGTYTVTVTDANGCDTDGSVTLNSPTGLAGSSTVTSDYNGQELSCYGSSDGEITASASGGIAPYTYLWSDTGAQITAIATGLPAGSYTVTITDANGCTTTASSTIADPLELLASAGPDQNICSGDTVTIMAFGVGGTGPYTYSWNNSETTASFDVFPTDSTEYIVTITDGNACTAVDTVWVNVNSCSEICDNGIDDDLDGLVDCDDPECAPIATDATLNACDYDNESGNGSFFLHDANNSVTAEVGVSITYHPTMLDANNGTNVIYSPYSSASNTVFSRVENTSSGCFSVANITLTVGAKCIENCNNGKDEDGDGLIDCEDSDCPCCESYAPTIDRD